MHKHTRILVQWALRKCACYILSLSVGIFQTIPTSPVGRDTDEVGGMNLEPSGDINSNEIDHQYLGDAAHHPWN